MNMIINKNVILNYVNEIKNENTRNTYSSCLNLFLKFIKKTENTNITQDNIYPTIYKYKSFLLKRYIHPKTINQQLIIVKSFFNDYTDIYVGKLKLLKTKEKPINYLTPREISIILEDTTNTLDSLIIRLLAYTGIRLTEALQLKKRQLKYKTSEGHVIITVRRKSKERHMIIPSSLAQDLIKYSKYHITYIFESESPVEPILKPYHIQRNFKILAQQLDAKYTTTFYSKNLKTRYIRNSYTMHGIDYLDLLFAENYDDYKYITSIPRKELKKEDIIEKFSSIGEYAK